MSASRSSVGIGAMSLIELLCVMAIIAMLAALLLPALGQAQARARRLQCVDHLHQIGVGFVNYANDHSGQFPMAVPMSAGGTLELAQGGYRIEGDFYFSYRHFQAASNELVTPKLVVCPADSRPPATSFATLSNTNLSYFIGVNAEAVQSSSILAGDRNLTNDYAIPGTLVRFGRNYSLRWTDELHRYKGNLLFSDGHVAEKNGPALVSTDGQVPAIADLALPTVLQPGTTPSSPSVASSARTPGIPGAAVAPSPGSFGPVTNARALLGAISVTRPGRGAAPEWLPFTPEGAASKAAPSSRGENRSTNEVAAITPAKPQEETPSLSKFASWLAATTTGLVEKGIWWFYALLLLLAVAVVVLRGAARGRRTKRGRKSPMPH